MKKILFIKNKKIIISMPQLDKVTYLSQYVWFCVFFLSFYLFLTRFILPSVHHVLAVRRQTAKIDDQRTLQVTNNQSDLILDQHVELSNVTSAHIMNDITSVTPQAWKPGLMDLITAQRHRRQSILSHQVCCRIIQTRGLQRNLSKKTQNSLFRNAKEIKNIRGKNLKETNSKKG